ncbi:hypothetical protein K1728_05500 [Weissella confusa]|uniref:hypothetical protein n=1 Tax=Weissella confusa TaxID=1583 RepID=UPI001C6F9A9C|nr:hypothetical protein [Weissella confusa]QYU58854.1 hypothetical protein K1728_05500 [Weissella confusa]
MIYVPYKQKLIDKLTEIKPGEYTKITIYVRNSYPIEFSNRPDTTLDLLIEDPATIVLSSRGNLTVLNMADIIGFKLIY